jgi:hypothetical protein
MFYYGLGYVGSMEVKVSGFVVNIDEIKKLFLKTKGGTSWP